MTINTKAIEQSTHQLGREIFGLVGTTSATAFDPAFYTGLLLDWAMRDEEFKISLFRFVDVLPALTTAESVIRHVQEYLGPVADRLPKPLQLGLQISATGLTAKVAAPLVRKQIRSIASGFILGETPELSLNKIRKIRESGAAFTIDLLGEASVSEAESKRYLERYLHLLSVLEQDFSKEKAPAALISNHIGEQTAVNISVKLSALYSQISPINSERSVSILSERFSRVLSRAQEIGAFVYLDMEDSSTTEITLEVFKRVLFDSRFKHYERVGIVLQAYLKRTRVDLENLITWGKERGCPFGVRLVKGAYWDTETILADQKGWPAPVWQYKESSDRNFEELSLLLLTECDLIHPAFGSHNIRSLCYAIAAAQELGVPKTKYELQFLYGMADPIKRAFIEKEYLVREYSPIGELIPGMGYLVRRLLENTSNESFLRQNFREHENPESLLATPGERSELSDLIVPSNREIFSNIAHTDFSIAENRRILQSAISSLIESIAKGPRNISPVVADKKLTSNEFITSVLPENPQQTLAKAQTADVKMANKALDVLTSYFTTWRSTSVSDRAEILFRAAELMLENKAELTAIVVCEAGKPWIEADAEVAEAIDFLNYYAHQARELFEPRLLGQYLGETNSYFYQPRGITAVICPWNFPLAIPCGMVSAALVTGNCAVLKPAEQTPLIAERLYQILIEAGTPANALAFLPGRGEEVGSYLVQDARISTIVFTGSREVGLKIIQTASKTVPGQEHVKRVIAEMGGKNAIIIDDDADLDEAVHGVIYSAFGYQGQKCSACSRLIVVGKETYERLIPRLEEATKSLIIGRATAAGTFVGPVIDKKQQQNISAAILQAKKTCRVIAEASVPTELTDSYFIPPIIFGDIPEADPIESLEIFGPVLAVWCVDTFEEALKLANASEYGLTGAVFSRSPQHLELACRDFLVGNLYINRPSTGALVMRQPFGGSKMSGIGSKAGGPDYLRQFVIPFAVSENTMRRGFAPM